MGEVKKRYCLSCSKDISEYGQGRKFCSFACYNASRFKAGEHYCEVCGSAIVFSNSRLKSKRFCGRKCSAQSKVKDIEHTCAICGVTFKRKSWQDRHNKGGKFYCSEFCYLKRSPSILIKCSFCGEEFKCFASTYSYYKKHYCSNKCRLSDREEMGLLTRGIPARNRYQKFVASLRSTVNYLLWKKRCLYRDGYRCVVCGRKSQLTVHHKKYTMYWFVTKYGFNRELILNDINFLDYRNGETLCRGCHLKKHLTKEVSNV